MLAVYILYRKKATDKFKGIMNLNSGDITLILLI